MRYLLPLLLSAICLADYVSLKTSDTFHRPDCRYVAAAEPNSLDSGSYDHFSQLGKKPCKVCSPEIEQPPGIAGYTIEIKQQEGRLFIQVRVNMLKELKDLIPDNGLVNSRTYARFAANRYRLYSWAVDTQGKVIVSIEPITASGNVFRPLARPTPEPRELTAEDIEAMEMLKELIKD